MTARLPLLVLALVGVGGVVAASAEGARPTLLAAPPPIPGLAAPVASPEDALASTWYCAAGTAVDGGLADHTVVVANPTDHDAAGHLTVFPGHLDGQPLPSSGPGPAPQPVGRAFAVPARDQVTFRLADVQPSPLASALVEVDRGGVVVEHRVVGPLGEDAAPCVPRAAPEWHFGWGSTARDATELLVLFNPFPGSVTVDATFATEAGVREPLRWQGLTVPAHGVLGIDVGQDVTRRDHVAATVRARGGGRLVVDRLQTFDGSSGRRGLDLAPGQPAGVEMSLVAHGWVDDQATERIILYNPGREPAEVDVAVRGIGVAGAEGDQTPPQPFGIVVRPGRFEVVDYGAERRVPRGVGHMTVVRSHNGVPVVAEQVLARGTSLASTPGAVFVATTWMVGVTNGRVDDSAGETITTGLVIANPDRRQAVAATVELVVAGQLRRPRELRDIEVPAGGQISVADVVGSLGPDDRAGRPQGNLTAVVVAEAPVVVVGLTSRDGVVVSTRRAVPAPVGLRPLGL